jgi:sugar lactone lactonase YvrE
MSPLEWCPADLELGEGPRWVDDRLVLVDILSGRLLEADGTRPGPIRTLFELDAPLGAVAPVVDDADRWIAAVGTGIALLSSSGELEWLARPADGGIPRRMNDAACDPAGRFWAGCMAWDSTPGAGALFRADHDGSVTQVLDGLTIPNGPAFTGDGSLMYLADSARGIVLRFPVDPQSGDLGDPTSFVVLEAGSPDGMTVDTAGNLWIAVWGLGEVHQYAPDGTLLTSVRVPAPQPTAPCLGGADGRRMFVTTAGYGLPTEKRGLSGSVFSFEVSVPGTPASAYRAG